ncbi:MAG: PAS domain S-box protein [Tildeniella nuda ZEHNDER 1965/U140]|jgi:PAS domain S-box-containing protein|nr:PAS domain S-box protein [Tildeniella nuda ZEHNDER 1965/U140]
MRFRLLPYVVAALAATIALLLTQLLYPLLNPLIYPFFFAAIAVSAWFGGFRPGLLAIALSTLYSLFFLVEPLYSFKIVSTKQLIQLLTFLFVAFLITVLCSQLQAAKRKADYNLKLLRLSERRFSHLSEADLIGIITTDLNGALVEANDVFLSMLGYTREELRSGRVDLPALTPPAYLEAQERSLHALRTAGVSTPFETAYSRKDSTYISALIGSALMDETTVISFVLDISDRKQIEAALLEVNARLEQHSTDLAVANEELETTVEELKIAEEDLLRQNEQLRTAQQRYQDLFDFAPDGYLVTDTAGIIQEANQAMTAHLSSGLAGLLGQPLFNFVANQDLEVFRDRLNQLAEPLSRQRAQVWVMQLQTWQQRTFPAELTVGRVYDSTGNVSSLRWLIRDITERERAEAKLRESENLYRAIGETLDYGIWVCDPNGRNVYASDSFLQLVGLTQAQCSEFGWSDVLHPDDAERTIAAWNECVRTEGIWDIEHRFRGVDGNWHPILARGMPVRDEDGKITAWAGINLDISRQKRVEAALRQSEERYRSLAELIPQLVWTASSEGALLDVNQRWLDFTGLTYTQAQAEGWQTIVHPDDVPILGDRWLAAQAGSTYYRAEGRMRRRDGVYRWHLHQAVPLKDERGQVLKWFGTATDIDGQKLLEQQRDRLLEQEQTAREAAENANRIKDEFLAVLSHELRSPLNPILGWSRLLQTSRLDEAQTAEALKTIERNARLQAELIEDLLDVSRILQGKLSLNVAPVVLTTTIQAAIETVRLAADAKAIQIQTRLEPNVRYVAGDANRLQQVIWNLLSNAVKFTPTEGRVDIRLEQLNAQAQITVADTGKGIAPDFLPYVFDYFRQAEGATTRSVGGLGLGLAIVRQLVELHGGTIRAESPGLGQGATFTVILPLMPTQLTVNQVSQSSELRLNLDGIKVLVVDDDADARAFTTFLLEQYGATVTAVTSAAAALTAIAQTKPDVLLSDIGMPAVDGYMLMQQVRALPLEQGGHIPAIALTAYAGEIDYQRSLAAGFQQHLAKPIEPVALITAIVSLVRGEARA